MSLILITARVRVLFFLIFSFFPVFSVRRALLFIVVFVPIIMGLDSRGCWWLDVGFPLVLLCFYLFEYPDSKVHGANMGPIWGWQDPGGAHVGPMNFVIWVCLWYCLQVCCLWLHSFFPAVVLIFSEGQMGGILFSSWSKGYPCFCSMATEYHSIWYNYSISIS